MKVKSSKSPKPVSSASLKLRNELLLGLQHLRLEAKEIARLYAANLQRDMAQLSEFVAAPMGLGVKARRLQVPLARMKRILDGLQVKPEKGRRKDLRRIEQAIRSMTKLLPPS